MSELAQQLIAENKARHARGEDASYLDLGNCGLTELPDLSALEWLETLVVSNEWVDWESLKFKESDNEDKRNPNYLKSITAHFLPQNLKKLVIGGDSLGFNWPISELEFLVPLNNLVSLYVNHTKVTDFHLLKNLTKLTSLSLIGNSISEIQFLETLTNLTFLNLAANQISDGDFLEKLPNLQSLDLSSNQITNCRFLEKLTNLKLLRLGTNKIYNLGFLENLTNLTSLNLSANPIRNEKVIENLINLTALYLSGNGISDVSFLGKLTNLTTIYIADNQISDIQSLENLTNLTLLGLHGNNISDIRALEKLTKLVSLDISSNQISDIKPLLPLIKKGIPVTLKEYGSGINLFNNPLTNPPVEIVQQGKAAILNWFSERSKTQFQNTEIKLIFIGNSTAGKTSLSRYLREGVFEHGQSTTHGIQNCRWAPEGRKLEVNCWDFGGQEYYHATHRLFLSCNSVYALVWDAQTDAGGHWDTDIHYEHDPAPQRVRLEHFPHRWWLQNIRHCTRGSNPPVPVLLVQNKCARDGIRRVSSDLEAVPYSLLPEWLDNHIDLESAAMHQSAPSLETRKWQRNFETFEERLLEKLETQLTHYEFATYHRDIRDEVRRRAVEGLNDMSYAAFEALCRGFDEEAKMDLVQIYLRDITGDILYYPGHLRLRERVFLRPDWVCNRIYQILSREVLAQQGLFGLDWVKQALQCDVEKAHDFVELMREFELIFDDSDEQGQPTGQYVAPQYLPNVCPKPDKLEAAKEYANLTHAFTLWFPDFLPKSHIARFVAHWGGQAKQRLFWKNGLLFQTKGCTALVERSEEYKIRVDIQAGDTAKRAAAMGRIFQSFLDLEDGQAGFAVSLNAQDFVWWPDAQEAIHTRARQVKTYPPEAAIYTDVQPFTDFQKPVTMAKKVFISYSHRDEDAMKELDKFLGPLERKGDIEIWTDRKILPGQNWKDEILHALHSADLTLLLVSANFLDSNFINDEEIPRAFQRREAEGKHVVPIILNYCLWDITDIGALQAIPKDGRPIADYPNAAQGWSEVARGVMDLLNHLVEGAPAAPVQSIPLPNTPHTSTRITDSKNIVSGTTTAGGNVHIGDVYHHSADAPQTYKTSATHMTPTEQQGIERAIELKIKVINKLRETLALEDDPTRIIRYEEQLRAAERELAELKIKLG